MNSNSKLLYSVKELKAFLPISESAIYAYIDKGEIPCVKIGRRKLVPASYLDEIMKKCVSA